MAADVGHRIEDVPDGAGPGNQVSDPAGQHAQGRGDNVTLADGAALVAEQGELQAVVAGEAGVLVPGGRADPDHVGPGVGEYLVAVAEGARLSGAARSLVLGVEVQDDVTLAEPVE